MRSTLEFLKGMPFIRNTLEFLKGLAFLAALWGIPFYVLWSCGFRFIPDPEWAFGLCNGATFLLLIGIAIYHDGRRGRR